MASDLSARLTVCIPDYKLAESVAAWLRSPEGVRALRNDEAFMLELVRQYREETPRRYDGGPPIGADWI